MNQMPSMPAPLSPATSSPESSDSVGSPSSAEDSVSSDAGSAEAETPVESPVAFHDPTKLSNTTKIQSTPRRGIKVVAVEKGFYNQSRIEPGLGEKSEFTIRSEEDFGEWFRCIDPVLEAKREEAMKLKKVRS
jgi:hypothetical protein